MGDTNYLQTIDCKYNGRPDCEWVYESHTGKYDYWGKGTMKYRRCLHCQTIDYLEFTDDKGRVTDITAWLKDPDKVKALAKQKFKVKKNFPTRSFEFKNMV